MRRKERGGRKVGGGEIIIRWLTSCPRAMMGERK